MNFIMFVYQEHFKNKIKNIKAQIGEILRTPSLGRNLLVLRKKSVSYVDSIGSEESTYSTYLDVRRM